MNDQPTTVYSGPFGPGGRYAQVGILPQIWSPEERARNIFLMWIAHHNRIVRAIGMEDNQLPYLLPEGVSWTDILSKAKDYEKQVGHDLVALLQAVTDCFPDEPPFHVGLTSSDVIDQAVLMQIVRSIIELGRTVERLIRLIAIKGHRGDYDKVIVGRTHLQPAEPTTQLHRMVLFIQDLYGWSERAQDLLFNQLEPYANLMAGSVGSRANLSLIEDTLGAKLPGWDTEKNVFKSQTLPRVLHVYAAQLVDALASILHKFAFDFRIEAGLENVLETKAEHRVGSSAMPYKKNPITAEKVDSLTRHVHHLVQNAWDSNALQLLERTLDDSANGRAWLPESFIAIDYALYTCFELVIDLSYRKEEPARAWVDLWGRSRAKTFVELHDYLHRILYVGKTEPLKVHEPYLSDMMKRDHQYVGMMATSPAFDRYLTTFKHLEIGQSVFGDAAVWWIEDEGGLA